MRLMWVLTVALLRVEALADLGVAQAREQGEHLGLAGGEPARRLWPWAGNSRPQAAGARLMTAVTRRSLHGGVEVGLPGVDRPDGGLDLLGAGVLGQVTARSRLPAPGTIASWSA